MRVPRRYNIVEQVQRAALALRGAQPWYSNYAEEEFEDWQEILPYDGCGGFGCADKDVFAQFREGWFDAGIGGYPPCQYRLDPTGWVILRGFVQRGTEGAPFSLSWMFSLPVRVAREGYMLIPHMVRDGASAWELGEVGIQGGESVDTRVICTSHTDALSVDGLVPLFNIIFPWDQAF